jgi:hypothetical protein
MGIFNHVDAAELCRSLLAKLKNRMNASLRGSYPVPKRLFLTYAWVDNSDGDFDYIVQQLEKVGVVVEYDRVALTPGRRLWEQIGERLSKSDIDGWVFIVTTNSLRSEACLEEYYIALDRALNSRGKDFPLMALIHGASFKDLPPSLQIRLGASLSDPNWVEKVLAGIEHRAPRRTATDLSPYLLRWHPGAPDNQPLLEIRPRLETLNFWRLGVPIAFKDSLRRCYVAEWPSGTLPPPFGTMLIYPIEGEESADKQLWIIGARGPIGNGTSVYIGLNPPFPPRIVIGREGGRGVYVDLPSL